MLPKISLQFLYSSIDDAEWRGPIQNFENTGFSPDTLKPDIKYNDAKFSWFCKNVWFTCIRMIDIKKEDVKVEIILGIDMLSFPEGFPMHFNMDYTNHSTQFGLRSSQILLNLSNEEYSQLYDYYSKLPKITNDKSLVYTSKELNREIRTKTLDNVIGLDDLLNNGDDTA